MCYNVFNTHFDLYAKFELFYEHFNGLRNLTSGVVDAGKASDI